MKQRIITAAVCLPIGLLMVILGGWWLGVLLLLLTAFGIREYISLVQKMAPQEPLSWDLLGIAYLLLGFLSMLGLRLVYPGFLQLLWLLLTIWITDSGAYFIGRRFGRRPLAPRISPHKTWEGAIGGGFLGMLLAGTYLSIALHLNFFLSLLLTLAISSLGQMGDLLESKVKRLAGVKDSGTLFPGHGGVLDRFDSLLLSAPFAYVLLLLVR